MPPLPKLRIAALDDLARQLRFAPVETLRRQLERARQMAPEINPGLNYPEDWIIYRITGYRPQMDDPAMLVGEALLSDISALIERLSDAAEIEEAELSADEYLDTEALRERWHVSRKTLDRYRRAGLVALRVLNEHDRSRHVFPLESVLWFEARNEERLGMARTFERLDPKVEARMARRGGRYAGAGLSLNQAAARIARRYGRGHETVRQVLQRTPAVRALFRERGPPALKERRLIERAYWLWVDPSLIGDHTGRSRASVQRIITDGRAARLRGLELAGSAGGAGTEAKHARRSSDAAGVRAALEVAAAQQGLGTPGETDLLRLVQAGRATPAPAAAQEQALALGYHGLLARCRAAIGKLPKHGARAMVLDRIETDLRWAVRLKAALVQSQFGQLVRTFESSLDRPLEEVRTSLLRPLVVDGIGALAQTVDAFEPRKGGRLAAAAGLALNRVIVRHTRSSTADMPLAHVRPRATARLLSSAAIDDWTLSLAAWQRHGGRYWLEPDPRIRNGLGTLDERARVLLVQRFGWDGPPQTHVELAGRFESTPMLMAQRVRSLVQRALAAARRGGV